MTICGTTLMATHTGLGTHPPTTLMVHGKTPWACGTTLGTETLAPLVPQATMAALATTDTLKDRYYAIII